MDRDPSPAVVNFKFSNANFMEAASEHRYRKSLQSVRPCYYATVPVGLLDEVLMFFDNNASMADQCPEICQGWKISS